MKKFRMGIDIGGTFTDFSLYDEASVAARIHKCLTTPDDPSRGVLDGVAALLAEAGLTLRDLDAVVHGTTLVTNAVIERRGVPTAMLVTRGFADLLNIGRERRYDLFDLTIRFPAPVVPRALRFEVPGRMRFDGTVLETLYLNAIEEALERAIDRHRIESVAVCFLHSYANPEHEAEAVAWLAARYPGLAISSSADVFPFMREYERWTTTCLNAYVQPVVSRYLDRIESGLADIGFTGQFLVMNSSGGTLTSAMARRYPIRLLESGPAAGALMSARHGQNLGLRKLLSFDMGGTTAKGCIVQDGVPLKRYDLEVGRVHEFKKGSGLPVKIPVLDMIEIGAGGGSLAQIDDRGVIKVGPQSAGARPGPASYGLGGARATLTDANLVLGYLGADSFLGGEMHLDKAAAIAAIRNTVADALGLDVLQAAWGIHEIINEDVARAFRVHASERGVDYRQCSMVVFGGSGPIHGTSIARKLRVPWVVCPVGAGVMSAFGLLSSPIGFEIVRSKRVALSELNEAALDAELRPLGAEISAMLVNAGVAAADIRHRFRLDMRYEGQGYEIEVPIGDNTEGDRLQQLCSSFEAEYHKIFGLTFAGRPTEIVNWKVEAEGPKPQSDAPYRLETTRRPRTRSVEREMWIAGEERFRSCAVHDRYALKPGDAIDGPAIVEEAESTCVLLPGDRLTVDRNLNLVIEIGMV